MSRLCAFCLPCCRIGMAMPVCHACLLFCLHRPCPQASGRTLRCETARLAMRNRPFGRPERPISQLKNASFASCWQPDCCGAIAVLRICFTINARVRWDKQALRLCGGCFYVEAQNLAFAQNLLLWGVTLTDSNKMPTGINISTKMVAWFKSFSYFCTL